MSKEHFLFLHIPKAGGSTLRTILQRQFRNQPVYLIGDDINGDIQRFREMDREKASKYSLVMGHMRFGLHTQFNDKYCYLSMLREPVARVISEYRFLKSNPYHSLHAQVKDMSLDTYLDSDISDQISNGQVRLLCATENLSDQGVPLLRDMTEADLVLALKNVKEHFKQIGFIERYDESLLLWRKLFAWRIPFYIQRNVGGNTRVKQEVITDKQREKIATLNALDLLLYNNLLSEFDQQLKDVGRVFRFEISLFKVLNKLYTYYTNIRSR